MAKRHHHYEAAFEALLREERIPYVAVDEKRRALVAQSLGSSSLGASSTGKDSLKSVDFLVSPPGPESYLVDIKGRQFPSGRQHKQYWRNWSTRDDLRSLAEWARYFGAGFTPLLVFGFELVADRSPVPVEDLWHYQNRTYGFVAVPLADYWRSARTLSARWDTVSMPAAQFRESGTSWRRWFSREAEHAWQD
jgi:hypothetical protein